MAIKALLDAQVANNRMYLSLHSGVPPLYASGVRYEHEPQNFRFQGKPVEEFALIPICIARGWGDCLLKDSLVRLPDSKSRPISALQVGDRVMTRNGPRRVTAAVMTGKKPVRRLRTNDGGELYATGAHRFRRYDEQLGASEYVKACELSVGQSLVTDQGEHTRLTLIEEVSTPGETWDITVEGEHHFFAKSPSSRQWFDVHNCDDLAPWRVAELQHHGEPAKIRIQWKRRVLPNGERGRKYFHIVVRRADGSIEDPSAKLGMYQRPMPK